MSQAPARLRYRRRVGRQSRQDEGLKPLWVALALLGELHNEVRNRGSRLSFVERASLD